MDHYIRRPLCFLHTETPDILNEHRALRPPMINWSACGSVSIDEAEAFAKDILDLVSIARNMPK